MKKLLISLGLLFSLVILAGCQQSSKPLKGLVIKTITINGHQTEASLTSLAAALTSKGAEINSDNPKGEELNGTVTIETVGRLVKKVSFNIRSKSGNLAAYETYNRTPEAVLTPNYSLDQVIASLSRQVADTFAEEFVYKTPPPAAPATTPPATTAPAAPTNEKPAVL